MLNSFRKNFNIFQTLRKLKTLDLHGNNLTALKRNQFKNLRDVEILDISHNNITKLDSSHIADLTKMSWCNVSHNALNELTRYVECIVGYFSVGGDFDCRRHFFVLNAVYNRGNVNSVDNI